MIEAAAAPGWTPRSALAVALCFAINMIDGMDVLVLSYVAPVLQEAWRISPARLGLAFSAGLGGMAIGGIVLAPLADRVGRKRMILIAIAAMGGAMLLGAHAAGIGELVASRIVVGAALGTVLACMASLAAAHAPAGRRDFAVGVLQAGYPLGATLTGFVVAHALPAFGWRAVLAGSGGITLAMLPLLALLLPATAARGGAQPAARAPIAALLADGRQRTSLLLWCGTVAAFMVLYFIVSWITKVAIQAGLAQADAIVASAIYNLGAMTGTVGLSVLAARIDVRRSTTLLLGAAIVAMLVFGGVRMSVGPTLAVAFALGVTLGGGFNGYYPLAARAYPAALRTAGIGWTMGIGRIGAFAGPLLGGVALGLELPLIAVLALFCVPLAIAAGCAAALPAADRGYALAVSTNARA